MLQISLILRKIRIPQIQPKREGWVNKEPTGARSKERSFASCALASASLAVVPMRGDVE